MALPTVRPPRRRAAAAALVVVALALSFAGSAAATPGELPVPEHSASDARAAADDVLDRPEFKQPTPTILQRIRTWIAEQLARLFGRLVAGGAASILAWLILAAALGVIAFFIFRFARGVTTDATSRTVSAPARLRTAEDWRAEAVAHEKQGEWRAGLRCRYRALVADLAQRGLVDEVPGRTTGEYRSEVGQNVPKVAPEFGGATELFEAAWYGNRPTGEEESGRFRELAEHVLTGASS
ncbi:MAG TPA: DUF4129 domain-containing protein [Acidimicrobiales bacterium]|nr:DUF4129 domain-containing protein [Acidimicrobiales bacterium]